MNGNAILQKIIVNQPKPRWFGKVLGASLLFTVILVSPTLRSQVPGSQMYQGLGYTVWLQPDGTVWTAGTGTLGQLGNGCWSSSAVPVQVPGLEGAVAVSVGVDHTLALLSTGEVAAFGANQWGQLGDGTTTPRCVPVKVLNLEGILDIHAEGPWNFALKRDGTLWGWGLDGANTVHPEPVPMSGLTVGNAGDASWWPGLDQVDWKQIPVGTGSGSSGNGEDLAAGTSAGARSEWNEGCLDDESGNSARAGSGNSRIGLVVFTPLE